MSEQAVESLQAALMERTRHFIRMDGLELLRSAVDLIRESGVEFKDRDKIPVILACVAAAGSIDAVAMMVAMGCSQDEAATALLHLAERSDDLKEGLHVAGLAAVFEEWAEQEIKAGRMTKCVCPKTGKTLYSTVEGKSK